MKSHRDIKGETFNIKPEPPKLKNVHHEKVERKPSKSYFRKMKAKKTINWTLQTIAGENKIGEGLHGILDLFPIPNQIFAKSASYISKGNKKEAKQEMQKLISVRNGISVVAFILFASGVITIKDMVALLEAISSFL